MPSAPTGSFIARIRAALPGSAVLIAFGLGRAASSGSYLHITFGVGPCGGGAGATLLTLAVLICLPLILVCKL